MSEAEWKQLCREVTEAMKDEASPYITPVSHALSNDEGEHIGTGGYIEYQGRRLLLTNEHVLRPRGGLGLAHQFHDCEDVIRLSDPIAVEPPPIDLALCEISDAAWDRAHASLALPERRLAQNSDHVERELFFFIGYPGGRSIFLFSTLVSRSTPLLTQEPVPLPDDLKRHQFALFYNPERGERVDHSTLPLPEPNGLSGSLVWNTRRVEFLQNGQPWTPGDAQVCGILCRWLGADTAVVGTRIQEIRAFLDAHI